MSSPRSHQTRFRPFHKIIGNILKDKTRLFILQNSICRMTVNAPCRKGHNGNIIAAAEWVTLPSNFPLSFRFRRSISQPVSQPVPPSIRRSSWLESQKPPLSNKSKKEKCPIIFLSGEFLARFPFPRKLFRSSLKFVSGPALAVPPLCAMWPGSALPPLLFIRCPSGLERA